MTSQDLSTTRGKKFRRIMVIREGTGPHDWHDLLDSFAHEVLYVDLAGYASTDYVCQLVADCIIADCRVSDHEQISLGLMWALAERRGGPHFSFYDERMDNPYDRPKTVFLHSKAVLYDPNTAERELCAFLEVTPPVNYDEMAEQCPYLIRPQCLSLADMSRLKHSTQLFV